MPFSLCLWLVLSTAALCQDVRHKYVVYRGSAGPRYSLKGENPWRIRRAAFLIPLHPGCCLGESGFSNWGVRFLDTFRLRGWWCGSGDLHCHLPQLNENILWESGQQLVLITCLGMADVGSPCASFLCHLSATTQPCRQLPTCSPGSQALRPVKYLFSTFPTYFFFTIFSSNAQNSRKPGPSSYFFCTDVANTCMSTQVLVATWLPPHQGSQWSHCTAMGCSGWSRTDSLLHYWALGTPVTWSDIQKKKNLIILRIVGLHFSSRAKYT